MEMVAPPRDQDLETYRYTWSEDGGMNKMTRCVRRSRLRAVLRDREDGPQCFNILFTNYCCLCCSYNYH
ncbi:uncharacterized protein P884DRAFT_257566 [Thermothelomyces heterothallicus CBS 202.75]|uniref:uncharacterized protein n=1 Tax=Thermothelomyces heterothallicus CBS 202.75 TaxID=1149848 RepID=UPI0037425A66